MRQPLVVAAFKDVKPLVVGCGKLGCEGNHETYDVRDAVLPFSAISNEVADQRPEELAESIRHGVLVRGAKHTFATVLGMWWEDVSDN